MAEQVTMWKDSWGKLFDTEQEAVDSDTKKNFLDVLSKDIYFRETSAEEITDWIENNLTLIKETFNA
jgi:hypothetical protein